MPFIQENSSSHPCRQGGGSSDDFEELVQQLSDVLGPCSGLDSEEIDPGVIQQMMRSYTSKESEWEQYALLDPSKHYTRNLVDEGNGKSNLVGKNRLLTGNDSDTFHSLSWFGVLAEAALSTIMPMLTVL
jgi:cysteine dioxygenase